MFEAVGGRRETCDGTHDRVLFTGKCKVSFVNSKGFPETWGFSAVEVALEP